VYVRGHGPGGQYRDNYPAATLEDWARRLRGWSAHGIDVYVYFDNDQKSAAPADALRLRALLERRRSRSPRLGRRSSAEPRAQPSV
ncbi:MAG: DUF72 domain-containing protein, partial [Bradyrhizobium sp.]|nr:DUF72 domain-containing protein [Bradyrhizobium sp.]